MYSVDTEEMEDIINARKDICDNTTFQNFGTVTKKT